MCANHLNRCKSSLGVLLGFPFNMQGVPGGNDETGSDKDAHQMPVISMGTLIDVHASQFSFPSMATG